MMVKHNNALPNVHLRKHWVDSQKPGSANRQESTDDTLRESQLQLSFPKPNLKTETNRFRTRKFTKVVRNRYLISQLPKSFTFFSK